MSELLTDLSDLATDFADKFLERAEGYADEGKEVLKWGAKQAELAAEKWRDDAVTDEQFKTWLFKLTTVRVPAKLGAIAKRKARAELEMLLGSVFKALSLLAGAL